jgi:DHA1 family bicyclomycin/chloramphenicol resistance-like MFS transporter
MAIGSAGALALGLADAADLFRLVPLLFLTSFGSGVLFAVTIQGALQPVPEIAGLASGIFGAMQMLAGAAASALAASLAAAFGAPLSTMAATMTLFVVAAGAGFAGLVAPGLRRAAATAGEPVEKPAAP